MKNLLLALALLCVLTSCSKDDTPDAMTTEFAAGEYPQKWQLVKMTGNIANAPALTGAAMPWQEFYVFNSNSSFTKTRERNGVTTAASGTFKIENLTTEKLLTLTYSSTNDIIGSCTSAEATETLGFMSDGTLHNTWNACDGPGLAYKRVKFEAGDN
ncbi:hypothetical protein [Pontibacter sp. H249]|uniref:hypothetical protein n=1 Tax=Pontibacter sp. H249 TaxID=3133420 RepID=UPI0030BEC4D8